MNSESIFALAYRIITRSQKDYLTSTQKEILLALNGKYKNKTPSSGNENGLKLKHFIQEEQIEDLDKRLGLAINIVTAFYFFVPFILFSYLFWGNISFFKLQSIGFVYLLMITLLSSGISYFGNLLFCRNEKDTAEAFVYYRSQLWKETRNSEERYEREKTVKQSIREQELREKYL